MSSDATTVLENTKWLSFLCSSLDNMRNNNVMCDMSLTADDGRSFPCHMSVLAASSPLLCASVCGATESPYNMKVAGMTGHVLELLLQFVYSGNVIVTRDVSELTDVIKAAHQLQLTHITGTCEKLLREVQMDQATATYEIVHQKLLMAEYTSDVPSDQENEVSQKRNKKPIARYASDNDDDDDDDEKQDVSSVQWSMDFEPSATFPEPCHNVQTVIPITPTSFNPTPPPFIPPTCPSTASCLPTTHPRQRHRQASVSCDSMTTLKSCAVSPFELALVAVVDRLVQQVDNSHSMVAENHTLVQQLAGRETQNTDGLPAGISLPITSREELHAVEAILKDKAAIKQMIGAVSFIGGTSLLDTVRRLLTHIMTNYTAKHCNWKGKNNKVAFSKLALWEVLVVPSDVGKTGCSAAWIICIGFSHAHVHSS